MESLVMKRYTIRLNMKATYIAVVEGEFQNEGEAYEAARNQMEDADPAEFNIGDEQECEILSVNCFDE